MNSSISNHLLNGILRSASSEERAAISSAIGIAPSAGSNADALLVQISLLGGHRLINALRGGGISYAELVYDAASALKTEGIRSPFARDEGGLSVNMIDSGRSPAKGLPSDTVCRNAVAQYVDEVERQLLAKLMTVAYDQASPTQKAAIDGEVRQLSAKLGGKDLKGLKTTAALMAAGNLGGFATYTVMSTVLSTLSLGSLGFGAYTFASSLLSVVLGPAGWLALGVFAVAKIGGPDKRKVVQVGATIALISQRLKEESHVVRKRISTY